MYYVKKCKQCNQLIHQHKSGSRYILKNCCEHIAQNHQNTPLYEREIKHYFPKN